MRQNKEILKSAFRIRICKFFSLPYPDPSIGKQKIIEKPLFYTIVTSI
jgi:hypothetical protein